MTGIVCRQKVVPASRKNRDLRMKTVPRQLTLLIGSLLIAAFALPLAARHPAGTRETVERDLGGDYFVAGSTIAIDRPVAGDLVVAGGNVDVSAEVGGDVVVAGGNVRFGAAIRQGLYAVGGRISLNGPVQRNVRVGGGTIEIGHQAKIAGNVTAGGGEVRITGAIDGHVLIGGGHVVIDGTIGGNVEAGSGSIELGPNARITGKLRYASRDELKGDPAAQVQGGVERFAPRANWPVPSNVQERAGRGAGWVWSIGLMVIAAILVAALPGVYTGVAATVRARGSLAADRFHRAGVHSGGGFAFHVHPDRRTARLDIVRFVLRAVAGRLREQWHRDRRTGALTFSTSTRWRDPLACNRRGARRARDQHPRPRGMGRCADRFCRVAAWRWRLVYAVATDSIGVDDLNTQRQRRRHGRPEPVHLA